MNKLSEKYVVYLVEKELLHPIREKDSYQTLKNLLYTFVARDNPAKDSRSNRTFHAEFQGRPGLPEARHHRPVPADLREADLQVAASPVPVRLPE